VCDTSAMITNSQIAARKKDLLDLREALHRIAATASESAAVVELDQTKVGRLSRMDAMQAQAMAKAGIARDQLMLTRIAAALQRIEDGEYGVCLRCAEPINPKRLEVDPTATLCIDCAGQAEA